MKLVLIKNRRCRRVKIRLSKLECIYKFTFVGRYLKDRYHQKMLITSLSIQKMSFIYHKVSVKTCNKKKICEEIFRNTNFIYLNTGLAFDRDSTGFSNRKFKLSS